MYTLGVKITNKRKPDLELGFKREVVHSGQGKIFPFYSEWFGKPLKGFKPDHSSLL